jgi:hypothetical protein
MVGVGLGASLKGGNQIWRMKNGMFMDGTMFKACLKDQQVLILQFFDNEGKQLLLEIMDFPHNYITMCSAD